MDGQQVYVTGADGEQMVLSGPEAAALLAQAGINIGDNNQVLMNENEEEGGILQQQEEEGIIQVPEGSTVQEDGSIVAADGTILAPPGSVVTGEDGSLIMTQDASLLMQESVLAGEGGYQLMHDQEGIDGEDGDQHIYATPDGQFVTASGQLVNQHGQLINAEGQLVTSEGQIINSDGQLMTSEGQIVTSEGQIVSPEQMVTSEGHMVTSEGELLTTGGQLMNSEGQLVTSEGQLVTSVGQLVTSEGQLVTSEGRLVTSGGQLVTSEGQLVTSEGQLVTSEGQLVTSEGQLVTSEGQLMTSDGQLVTSEGQLVTPESHLVTSEGQLVKSESVSIPTTGQLMTSDGNVLTERNGEYVTADGQIYTSEQLLGSGDNQLYSKDAGGALPTVEQLKLEGVSSIEVEGEKGVQEEEHILSTCDQTAFSTYGSITAPGQTVYTTTDGTIVSAPEGTIMANADGNLVTADGTLLTSEDGRPVSIANGSILPTTDAGLTSGMYVSESLTEPATLAMPEGGIMVSAVGGTIMTTSNTTMMSSSESHFPSGLLTSEDGVLNAPEGSMITEDGSLVAADGTVLAPPGSIMTEDEQQHEQPQEQQTPTPSGNLIGLQLPDDNGEVLYLDPNDPAAQILLQEAGITMGEGGVLQTADGQILTNEEGNPITSNLRPPKNNLVAAAVAAAGLGAEELGFQLPSSQSSSSIDLPSSAHQQGMNDIRPALPLQSRAYDFQDDKAKHTFQPRYSTGGQQQQQQQQQQKFQKLTFNSAATYGSSSKQIQRKPVQKTQKRIAGSSSEVTIGPDQQKVTYTVTSENGYSQTYMMICSKSLDQNTLINTLIKNISNDPNHKGKKTIKITQHKYGAKKAKPKPAAPKPIQQRTLEPVRTITQTKTQYRNVQNQQVVRQELKAAAPAVSQQQKHQQQQQLQQQQQILNQEQDITEMITGDTIPENLSLEDIVNQIGETEGDPKVIVKCSYCTNFKSVLNSQTWENILNHILPVAREELHTAFYGNILKNFSRGLKVAVTGRSVEFCEVTVSHGLICRRTGTWYSVDNPGVDLAIQLATHIAAVQPGVSGPYGARPRGNSLICLFCASPYTAEDYQRHLTPHHGHIVPCLLLAAGAYCASSFELEIKKPSDCDSCGETEHQDMRFLPCTKFASDFNCSRKLQATVDCFRENFDSRGFLQVSNSAMTKCSVCRAQNLTYCALFKVNSTSLIQLYSENEMLAVCANCQKQFVNVVMRENSFDKQLKMFQLHHMEQLCGVLRVLLSSSSAICSGNFNLLYTVQEGGSLYSATNTIHTVVPARPLHTGNQSLPIKGLNLQENKNIDMSGPSIRFVCDQCKFAIDLTRLEHGVAKADTHLVDMAIGVVLEHIVPHTDSLLAVIMTAATNEVFSLKYEFTAHVEGDGSNRRINISLDRKIVPCGTGAEVSIQKELYKTIEGIKSKIKLDKKGHVMLRGRYMFFDINPAESGAVDMGFNVDVNRFLDQCNSVISLYGASGCNTRLLDYYSECRLCSKFSFPDFRLTAAIKNKEGVSLCENCCETILSLCVPSEPEKIGGRGESCLLLGIERNTGHRLVLSNQSKKWISADGVEKIQTVSEVAASASILDYNNILVQQLKSHLLAVSNRAWSDPDCVTARAGFLVKNVSASKLPQIEVKVTLRPPKPKTPPPKLQITPVTVRPSIPKHVPPRPQSNKIMSRGAQGAPTPLSKGILGMKGPTPTSNLVQNTVRPTPPSQKLVKITANRRIIPVRDPTSISSPIRPSISIHENISSIKSLKQNSVQEKLFRSDKPESSQEKIAAMRAALQASKAAAENKTADSSKSTDKVIEIDDDDEDAETLEDIANFISNSDPVNKDEEKDEMYTLQDEFTDNSLKCSQNNKLNDLYNLPKGTIVTNVGEKVEMSRADIKPEEKASSNQEKVQQEKTKVKMANKLKAEEEKADKLKTELEKANMLKAEEEKAVKLKADEDKAAEDKLEGEMKKLFEEDDEEVAEGGEEEEEVKISSSLDISQVESEIKPATVQLFKDETDLEDGSSIPVLPTPANDATTSTKTTPTPQQLTKFLPTPSIKKKSIVPRVLDATQDSPNSTAISSFKKNRGRPKKEQEDLSHLTSLDLVLDLDLDLEEAEDEEKEKTGERSPMKLSKILPKPTSSSFKISGTPKTPKNPEKRKREEEESKSKRTKINSSPEYKEETPDYMKGVSQSGRVRKAKKVFDM